MTLRKRQLWKPEDVFVVPMLDGRYCPGQIIGEKGPLNSIRMALFGQVCAEPEDALAIDLSKDNAFAALLVTRDLIDAGAWPIVGARPILFARRDLPWEHARENGWIGATVSGSANIVKFINAYFGLVAWDAWHDPKFLDTLLIDPDRKPSNVILSKREPT
jgi:hypothetical protein